MFNFSVFEQKYLFSENLVQKIKIYNEIWYLESFEYAKFNIDVHSFCFLLEIPFLGKFGQKHQNYQLKLNLFTQTNSKMQNLIVVFTFSVFDQKQPFLGKFSPKNHICQFQLKFGIQTNSNMNNSMVMFIFCVFDRKCLFLGKVFQKISKFFY